MAINQIETAISLPYAEIAAFCVRHHIDRFWLFGSVLRDDFAPDSDIDVLVEFAPEHTPGLSYFGLADELAEILGHPVDLSTSSALSKYIRGKVMRSVRLIYERTGLRQREIRHHLEYHYQ